MSRRSNPVFWDILAVYGQFSQLGLKDNVIYDILPTIPMAAVQETAVNATAFTFDCGIVSNATQSGFAEPITQGNPQGSTWFIDVAPQTSVELRPIGKQNLRCQVSASHITVQATPRSAYRQYSTPAKPSLMSQRCQIAL